MATTKSKPTSKKAVIPVQQKPGYRKPDGPPKIILGGGKNMIWMSDTLFDDDLKA